MMSIAEAPKESKLYIFQIFLRSDNGCPLHFTPHVNPPRERHFRQNRHFGRISTLTNSFRPLLPQIHSKTAPLKHHREPNLRGINLTRVYEYNSLAGASDPESYTRVNFTRRYESTSLVPVSAAVRPPNSTQNRKTPRSNFPKRALPKTPFPQFTPKTHFMTQNLIRHDRFTRRRCCVSCASAGRAMKVPVVLSSKPSHRVSLSTYYLSPITYYFLHPLPPAAHRKTYSPPRDTME